MNSVDANTYSRGFQSAHKMTGTRRIYKPTVECGFFGARPNLSAGLTLDGWFVVSGGES